MKPDEPSRPTSRVPRPSKDPRSDEDLINRMMPAKGSTAHLSAEEQRLRQEVQDLREELAATKQELDIAKGAAKAATRRVKRDLPPTSTEEHRLQMELEASRRERDAAKAELETAKGAFRMPPTTSRIQVDRPDRDTAKLQEALKAAQHEVRALKGKVGELEDQKATLELERDSLKDDLEMAQKEAKRPKTASTAQTAEALLPLFIFPAPADHAKGNKDMTKSELLALFPSPHLARVYVALCDLLGEFLAGTLDVDGLRAALSTVRQTELDAHFETTLTLPKLLHAVNKAGRVWFDQMYAVLTSENRKLVEKNKEFKKTCAERDAERASNQEQVLLLQANMKAIEYLLTQIETSQLLSEEAR